MLWDKLKCLLFIGGRILNFQNAIFNYFSWFGYYFCYIILADPVWSFPIHLIIVLIYTFDTDSFFLYFKKNVLFNTKLHNNFTFSCCSKANFHSLLQKKKMSDRYNTSPARCIKMHLMCTWLELYEFYNIIHMNPRLTSCLFYNCMLLK